MGMLLGFAPFIVFALVEKLAGALPGLVGAALVSIALLLRDRLRGEHAPNVLEAGSALLFTMLAVLAWRQGAQEWTLWRVRLWVDGGLLLVVLLGMLLQRPFTLQYARRQVSPEVARRPAFLRVNLLLSGVWALAFAVLAATDLLMVLRPATDAWVAVALTVGAMGAAAWFTVWYPRRLRAAALAAQRG